MSLGAKPFSKIRPVENPSERPPGFVNRGLEEQASDRLVGLGARRRPVEQATRPARRAILAPQAILPRPIDRVVLLRQVLHREARGDRLVITGIALLRRVGLARLGARL